MLDLFDLRLAHRIGERLRNRIVLDFLALDELACDLSVRLRPALEVLLGLVVRSYVSFPFVVAVLKSHGSVRFRESVTSRHFLIFKY